MSRASLILIVVLLLIVGGIVLLANIDTEVPLTKIEVPVANAPQQK